MARRHLMFSSGFLLTMTKTGPQSGVEVFSRFPAIASPSSRRRSVDSSPPLAVHSARQWKGLAARKPGTAAAMGSG